MDDALTLSKNYLTSPPLFSFLKFPKSFVFDTDASYREVGAVLAQKKKYGRVHLLKYSICMMKSEEINYATCELVELAFIFAMNKYVYTSYPRNGSRSLPTTCT